MPKSSIAIRTPRALIRRRIARAESGSPISALSGWLYAFQRSYVGTDLFEAYFLVLMLTAVIIAGRRVLLGPLLGTALLISQKSFASLGAYGDKLVLGAILVAVLCYSPRGLAALWPRRRDEAAGAEAPCRIPA